ISSPHTALFVWSALIIFVFLFTLLLFVRHMQKTFGLNNTQKCVILWVAFFGTLRYFLTIVGQGQTDAFAALLLVLFFLNYLKKRYLLCGILFAVLLQFKLFFLPLLVYFFMKKEFKLILSSVLAALFLALSPAIILGLPKTLFLTKSWFEILNMSVPSQLLNFKNQSIPYGLFILLSKISIIKNISCAQSVIYVTSTALSLLSYIGIFLAMGRDQKSNKEIPYLEFSLLLIASLIFSPISWEAYYVSLIIPLGITVWFILNAQSKKLLWTLVAFYFLLVWSIGTDFTKVFVFLKNTRFINISIGTVFLVAAMLLAFGKHSNSNEKISGKVQPQNQI
ncbi:MAG: glycosyltransferase 87 family protein, partial [Candidatus Omnitrophica bacterium]|nr:glycosyltransferase 87 family protein [Candidatus Omnitrophota bacterium]